MPKIVEDEQIFHAVMQVVTERGYSGATTKQMADAAKVSEVTLFRKYGSKLELVKQAISFIVEHTAFATAAYYTGDIHADLLRVVQAYQDSAVKHGFFFAALFSEMSRHPELITSINEPLNIFRAIGQLIALYQAEGVLKPEHPYHSVASLLGPLMYTALIHGALENEELPRLDLSNHLACFLDGRRVEL